MSLRSLHLASSGLLAALMFLFAFCLPAAAGTDSAKGCIQEIAKSIKNSDAQAFSRLVDIDSISKDAFAELESASKDPELSRHMSPTLLALLSQGVFKSPLLQPALVNEVQNFVLEGVGSGAFAGKSSGSWQGSQSLLGALLAEVSKGRKDICGIGQAVNISSSTWLVPFSVRDSNGSTYHLSGGVKRMEDGYMRLCYIDNMQEVIRQILN